MFTVLFVCTGNTCRSPMAQAILCDKINDGEARVWVRAESAGLAAHEGEAAAAEAIESMRRLGIRILPHSSRLIDGTLMQAADLILTMSDVQRRELVHRFPSAAGQIFTLGDFAGLPGDIPDPYGGSSSVYDDCAKKLKLLLEHSWSKIQLMAGICRMDDERLG